MTAQAKSICRCGHRGDAEVGLAALVLGKEVQHAGVFAHGTCLVEGCNCAKFTWAGWMPDVAPLVKKAVRR